MQEHGGGVKAGLPRSARGTTIPTERDVHGGVPARHLAVLAHYFDEAGADFVARLWGPKMQRPVISAVTVAELKGRLHAELGDESEAADAASVYLDELTECLPLDRAIAELAWQIRTATPERLPLVDALIAASARSAGAILVHRDPYLAAIPRGLVEQVALAGS